MDNIIVKDSFAFHKSKDKIKLFLGDTLRLATNLEAGAYDQPLSSLLKQKISEIELESFSAGILCSNESVRNRVLKWLFGEIPGIENLFSKNSDYLFLGNSNTDAFQLQTKIGNKEFSSIDDLLSVLETHPEKRSAVVGIPYPERMLPAVSFLIPQKIDILATKPALNSLLINRCNILVLAFSDEEDIKSHQQILTVIAPSFDVILYAVICSEGKTLTQGEAEKNIQKKFSFYKSSKFILPSVLGSESTSEFPSILDRKDNIFRQGLLLKKKSVEIVTSLSLSYSTLEDEKKEHIEKKTALTKSISQTGAKERTDKIREGVSKCKSQIQQILQDIEIKLKDTQSFNLRDTKRDIYDDDKGETPLVDRIVKIQINDLELKKVDSKSKKVAINSSYLDDIKHLTGMQTRKWLEDDIRFIDSKINNLNDELKKQSELLFDSEGFLEIIKPNLQIRSSFNENELIFKYSSSIPNFESFSSAFASARTSIMTGVMLATTVVSLLGYFLGKDNDLKTIIPVIGGVALIIMIFIAKSRAPEEEKAKLAEELEKVKEIIANEVLRALGDASRISLDLISREIRDWSSKMQKSLDDAMKKILEKIDQENQSSKVSLDKKILISDQKIKNIENILREFTRLQQEFNRVNDQINQDFQKLMIGIL